MSSVEPQQKPSEQQQDTTNKIHLEGPDQEIVTPGLGPKSGRLRPMPTEEADRQLYLEREARRRGEEYDELSAETQGGLPTNDSENLTQKRALAEGDLRLKAGEQGFKQPQGPAMRTLDKLQGRSES